jgi:hypothetical protein
MSELTKSFEIIAKHLSNAFLSMAADFRKLDTPAPLSQAVEKPEIVSIRPTLHKVPWGYQAREKVIVKFPNSESSSKMRVLKKLSDSRYLVYEQNGLKSHAKEITVDMILGLDPDR